MPNGSRELQLHQQVASQPIAITEDAGTANNNAAETVLMRREDELSFNAQYQWQLLLYPVRKTIEANKSLSRREQRSTFRKRRLELYTKHWGPPPPSALEQVASPAATVLDSDSDVVIIEAAVVLQLQP